MNAAEAAGLDRILDLLQREVRIVNLGLPLFAETLAAEEVAVLHVDWRPPAEGDEELAEMLAILQGREG